MTEMQIVMLWLWVLSGVVGWIIALMFDQQKKALNYRGLTLFFLLLSIIIGPMTIVMGIIVEFWVGPALMRTLQK